MFCNENYVWVHSLFTKRAANRMNVGCARFEATGTAGSDLS